MNNYNKKDDWAVVRVILQGFKDVITLFKTWIEQVNKSREGKYSSSFIGWCAALMSTLLLVIMLFVPPYLGMSDDGSFDRVANPVGIYHLEDTKENLYYNYYVKDYYSLSGISSGDISSQRLFIIAAKLIDTFFTRDNLFDLRFLALVYGLLFIPALALLVKQAVQRVHKFSEQVVIGFAGVLIFADVSYLTYFSSFYVEPMIFICFLLCVGSALALKEEKHNAKYLLIYTISGILLTMAKHQFAVIGIFLGIMCVVFLFLKKQIFWRVGCISAAIILFLSMLTSLTYNTSDFTQSSKYHAMTRGVLLEADDPEKALAEFGIDGSFATLTDTNSNDSYPFIDPVNKVLKEGFYDKYDTTKISYYYIKHPKAILAMLDISVKSAFDLRRSISGNYEKIVGMPKMAKSLFWSFWSSFKVKSAPRTIGFIIVLFIATIVLFRRKKLSAESNNRFRAFIPLEIMLLILLIGISQAMITVVNSGDAEMTQHLFLFSLSIDLLIYFCFAEILPKLNLI